MIDTTKIYSFISEEIYQNIKNKSNIKCMYNLQTNQLFYEIINDSLNFTYDSRLSVRVSEATKYCKNGYVLEIEGSPHKIICGHNCFNGIYNITDVVTLFITLVENAYNLTLPNIENWYLQRIDISKVFNLNTNKNVADYINNFRLLSYPRRNLKFYENESIYISGTTTTLKIYNKLKEFLKNDKKKLMTYEDFNLTNFVDKIQGYVRFEIEIKKRKLVDFYNKKDIKILDVKYEELEKIWEMEFMKMLKFKNEEVKYIKDKQEVLKRLQTFYNLRKANDLYSFFLSLKVDGENYIKQNMTKSTFYRKKSEILNLGIDISGTFEIYENTNIIDFNPFEDLYREIS
jgi:II/X family phage/plasmid replication protein